MSLSNHPKTMLQRFLRNGMAMLGGLIILSWLLIACFAYWIAPDHSPNANRQIPEIQNASAGQTQLFFLKPGKETNKTNVFQRWWGGVEDSYEYIPISSYQLIGDTLIIQKQIEPDSTEEQRYRLHEVLAGRSPSALVVKKTNWLGTDQLGRDVWSRLVVGTRVTLSVGVMAVLISLLIGTVLGLLAGYFGGRLDAWVVYLINVAWSIPTLLLVFGITMAMGKGLLQIYVAIGLTMWVPVARMVRTETALLRNMEYIQAAQILGLGHTRILMRHLLPNLTGLLIVVAAANFASAIMIEAGLSFLGLGVQAPAPSWGLMMRENYTYLVTGHALLAIIPGIAMSSLVLAFHALSNGLRDVLDVRRSTHS